MSLKEFEETLSNIQNDKMLMSYGDNLSVVNSLLTALNLVQSLSSVVNGDRGYSMYKMSMQSKLFEMESILVTQGYQLLNERGINIQGGMRPQYGMQAPQSVYNYYQPPMMQMPQMPMYSQPMMQAPSYAPPVQQAAPVYTPQPQMQPQPEPQAAPPPPTPRVEVAPAPKPAPQVETALEPEVAPVAEKPLIKAGVDKPTGSSSAGGALPGMGGGNEAPAAGRDYLLKLLEDK